jgi:hypothetical protein
MQVKFWRASSRKKNVKVEGFVDSRIRARPVASNKISSRFYSTSNTSKPFKKIYTETLINTSIENAWSVLTDFKRYSEWNPFITKIEGLPEVGQRLKVTAFLRGTIPLFLCPTIISLIPQQELIWVGNLVAAQVFQGEHIFLLEKIKGNEEQMKFIHTEKYYGLIHKPVSAVMANTNLAGFNAMNEAFKLRCEMPQKNLQTRPKY